MKLFEWLGLETRHESDKEAHMFAMRRTGGDPRWLHAMEVFKDYARQDAHAEAVKGGVVRELFSNTVEVDPIETLPSTELRPQISHVKIVLEQAVEVRSVTIFDQDQEAI